MALLVVAAIVGCNEARTTPQTSRAPDGNEQVVRRVQIGTAHWGASERYTLEQMVSNRTVALVRVLAADTRYSTGLIVHGDPVGTPPADNPKSKGIPSPGKDAGLPWTTYTAQVVDVLSRGGVHAGDSIAISQAGGLVDGIAYELEGDPVIEVGKTYLMSLVEPRPGLFTNAPYDRFELGSDDRLLSASTEWNWVPGVVALRGLSKDAAAAKIQEAIARAGAR